MHVKFELSLTGDRTDLAFRYLRVSMFRLYFQQWAEQYNIRDYQFSSHEGNVRVQFKHSSDYSTFALAWTNYNNYSYSIVRA